MEGRNGMLDSSSDGGGKEQQGGERREGLKMVITTEIPDTLHRKAEEFSRSY